MTLLIDMNLMRRWVQVLASAGIESVHWSTVGDPRAPDSRIFNYAREHGMIVFTHDLDFGIMLAKTRGSGPSVIQIRNQDVRPEAVSEAVVAAIQEHRTALASGAIVTVDMVKSRVRILPIGTG